MRRKRPLVCITPEQIMESKAADMVGAVDFLTERWERQMYYRCLLKAMKWGKLGKG